MKPCLQTAVVAVALLLGALPASGDSLRFQLITEASKGGSKLLYGVAVAPKDWPALVTAIVGSKLQAGMKVPLRCSGVIVGRGVLLTAAHCLDSGTGRDIKKSIEIELTPGQGTELKCMVPLPYLASDNAPPRTADDFALCTFQAPAGVHLPLAEVIDMKTVPRTREPILLTGFGCQEMEFKYGIWQPVPMDGPPVLTIADASISLIPVPSQDFKDGFISIISNVTNAQGEPALCSGDSGGPMLTGASLVHQTVPRRVRGVNSWVRQVGTSSSLMRSGIASLTEQGFSGFAEAWSASNPTFAICGRNGHQPADECRR